MKKGVKIIGLLLSCVMILNMAPPALAQTEPEKACTDKKPDYEALREEWEGAEKKNSKTYQEAFEKAQEAHHEYVGCLFDFAESQILQSEGAEHGGTIDANTLNTGSVPVLGGLIDWMAPDQACLGQEEIQKIIYDTEPGQLLAPVLQAHADYRTHLEFLDSDTLAEGLEEDESGNTPGGFGQLILKQGALNQIRRQRVMEVDSSLLAIDLMFTSLKELRLAVVIHIHFQCTLKFLEKYRKALENLRNLIEPLPDQLNDASVVK